VADRVVPAGDSEAIRSKKNHSRECVGANSQRKKRLRLLGTARAAPPTLPAWLGSAATRASPRSVQAKLIPVSKRRAARCAGLDASATGFY
jgi:hypothetical protein